MLCSAGGDGRPRWLPFCRQSSCCPSSSHSLRLRTRPRGARMTCSFNPHAYGSSPVRRSTSTATSCCIPRGCCPVDCRTPTGHSKLPFLRSSTSSPLPALSRLPLATFPGLPRGRTAATCVNCSTCLLLPSRHRALSRDTPTRTGFPSVAQSRTSSLHESQSNPGPPAVTGKKEVRPAAAGIGGKLCSVLIAIVQSRNRRS